MAKKRTAERSTTSEIILIKPGATDYDDQGRIQGNLDIPLNAHGAEEVVQIAESLMSREFDAIYAPSCEPALETARALSKLLSTKLKKLGKMGNLNLGLWQGMETEEVRRKQQRVYRQWQENPEMVCPPGGETIEDARRRMEAVLTKILKRHQTGAIGLVIPEPMASLVRQFLCGTGAELGDLWAATAARPLCECFTVGTVAGEKGWDEASDNPLNGTGRNGKLHGLTIKPAVMSTE